MQVRFWGTRGSIPVPGSQTIQYGGNTSCIEVLSDAGTLLIIDCGTGLRTLGQHLINSHANNSSLITCLNRSGDDKISIKSIMTFTNS